MQGEYLIWLPKAESPLVIPNLIPDGGKDEFYKMIFQNVTAIAGGANWYVGLLDQVPLAASLLTDVTTEPTSTGGYARQALVRSAVGWPTLATINGRRALTSATVTFTASGAAFSRTISRLFLTDAASGTAGKLYSVSGAISTPLQLPNGQSINAQYRLYL